MAITINGSGTITGVNAGGLPDGSVTADDLATDAVTTAKIEDDAVTTVKITDANITAAKLDGAQSGSAPIYGARAWVNFDGTGTIGTDQTIRGNGNVTNVYKNSTGRYTINFTTAMTDANYAVVSTSNSSSGWISASSTLTTSNVEIRTYNGTGASADSNEVTVIVFR